MELVMVGVLFTAMNFTVMSAFTSEIDVLVEPETEGTVEIYQVERDSAESSLLQRTALGNAKASEE